jgi:hypothetical protein
MAIPHRACRRVDGDDGESLLALGHQRRFDPLIAHTRRGLVAFVRVAEIDGGHEAHAVINRFDADHSEPPSIAPRMARRVNPRGIERPASQRAIVRSVQHSRRAVSASVSLRICRHSTISLLKSAVLAAREPVLSGVGVDSVRLRFTPIFCQPALARNHQFESPKVIADLIPFRINNMT